MDTPCQEWDQRSSKRFPKPGRLWCLGEREENFNLAWTVDQAKGGLSFVMGARHRVNVGETVAICYRDPQDDIPDCETLRVCRIQPYGPDHDLVACTRMM